MKQIGTMFQNKFIHAAAVLFFAALSCPQPLRAAMPESQRMERAKDLIADEQWARAVDELKAAAADPKETNKDEALFWLAHSQKESRDFSGAVETISRLERTFPASVWVKPARSLRIEIAQRLNRNAVKTNGRLERYPFIADVRCQLHVDPLLVSETNNIRLECCYQSQVLQNCRV